MPTKEERIKSATLEQVNKVIEEFEELGRDGFLRKYNISRARTLFINGKYDAKPIYRVASDAINDDFNTAEVRNALQSLFKLTTFSVEERTHRLLRLKSANKIPEKLETTITVYKRNQDVIAEVLYLADGKCGCCNNEAPFTTEEGEPYLEVHHIVHLACGGEDTVENAIALCPNCHRLAHHANEDDKKNTQKIIKNAARNRDE